MLISVHMSHMGHARLGAGCILQSRTGLRPMEMLSLVPTDITLPEEQDQAYATIGLGIRTNTKLKRPQSISIQCASDPELVELLRRLKLCTPPSARLFPYSIGWYRHIISKIEGDVLGLDFHWTGHSPRAGWASDLRARGVPFTEIRELGRWLSDASLRVYLDLVSSASIAVSLRTRGFLGAIAWLKLHWLAYFPAASLSVTYGA